MKFEEALSKMVAPGTKRPGKWRQGVIQIWTTRTCDKSCFGCTQSSQLSGGKQQGFISPEVFEANVRSLGFGSDDEEPYFGVVGVFGGNPALHPEFETLCEILKSLVPFEQRGLWCNKPFGKTQIMRETFNPKVSNLNVHLDQKAFDEFKAGWPEANVVGLNSDSRHSPVLISAEDLEDVTPSELWEAVSDCDINQHWSAMLGQVMINNKPEPRAWFCEIAGMQDMLANFHNSDYEPSGIDPRERFLLETTDETNDTWRTHRLARWWEMPVDFFQEQVRRHCSNCGVPFRGKGELSQNAEGVERFSTHWGFVATGQKKPNRKTEVVSNLVQLQSNAFSTVVDYIGNGNKK